MIQTLAISNYRSINQLVIPLTRLNLVTGANGSGKSNLYRALRLLAETAHGGLVAPLAREGGLSSAVWAGPEQLSNAMRRGDVPVQGTVRKHPIRLKLGFGGEDFGYAVTLGYSEPGHSTSAFKLDPQFKTESIWTGPFLRKAGLLIQREGSVVRRRVGREWEMLTMHLPAYESLFSQLGKDPRSAEAFEIHAMLGDWRFYDYFRTDAQAPVRQPSLGTRTPVLHHDGHDLVSALQTIREVGDGDALDDAIADAFPGAHVEIGIGEGGMFTLLFHQHGLLRPAHRCRAVRRHAALPVVGGGLADAAAARVDGVERAGVEFASGPVARAGTFDRASFASFADVGGDAFDAAGGGAAGRR